MKRQIGSGTPSGKNTWRGQDGVGSGTVAAGVDEAFLDGESPDIAVFSERQEADLQCPGRVRTAADDTHHGLLASGLGRAALAHQLDHQETAGVANDLLA